MNKRGITLSTLIAIILLVISFGIIIYFIWTLGFNQRADTEACHTSIVMRGTVASVPVADLGASSVPLKCKEKKICLASGLFGECKEFGGEKGITKVSISNQNDIAKTISQEIVECWDMTGQGKLDLSSELSSKTGIGGIHSSCIICARIAVDEKMKDSVDEKSDLGKINLLNYMLTHAVPGKDVSYIKYMLGNDIPGDYTKLGIEPSLNYLENTNEAVDQKAIEQAKADAEKKSLTAEQLKPLDDNVATDQQLIQEIKASPPENLDTWQGEELAVVFMQVTAPQQAQSLLNIAKVGIAGAAGSFIIAPIATFKIAGSLITNPYSWLTAGILAAGQQVNVAYQRHVAAGYCGDVSHGTSARNGCSVVRVFKYDPAIINQYCNGNIESTP